MNDKMDLIIYVETIYNELLEKQEKRGISYGEIAYIENLKMEELEELEKEIIKELEIK